MAITIPTSRTAMVVAGPGKLVVQQERPMPEIRSGMVLIKVAAVALNPVDVKCLDHLAIPDTVHGSDFAGTVVYASGRWAVGDRVAGVVAGMNKLRPEIGAFADYTVAHPDFLLKLPDSMSFEEGATLGTGLGSAAYGLFLEMAIAGSVDLLLEPRPLDSIDDESEFVLVAGGSTATGTRALQMIKLLGLRAIATASPQNYDLCHRFGAEKVFNYKDPDCAAQIRKYTQGNLAYILDCITQADTTQMCYDAMGRAGGRYVAVEAYREEITSTRALTITPSWFVAISVHGEEVALDGGYHREARPQDREWCARLFVVCQQLLDRGMLDIHPVQKLGGGWNGIIQGLDLLRKQKVSAHKLVCPIS